jgi:hypothetical protein
VGTTDGESVRQQIGPAGGRLESPDGLLAVVVPAGAFTQATELVLQPIVNHAHGGLGKAWRILPEGLHTTLPMTLEWRYSAEDGQANAGLAIATQRADGTWAALREVQHDTAQRTLRVQTRHFSDWSLVAGLQLRPAQATVEVGGSVPLSLVRCQSVNVSNDAAEIPLAACEPFVPASFDATRWAANGVTGGNATHGTVTAPPDFLYPGVARYLAPAQVPAGNPVAVSYRTTEPPFDTGITLVSQLRVLRASSGCDWLQDVQAFSAEVESSYAWSGTDGLFQVSMDHHASATGRLVRVPAQLPILRWRGALTGGQVRVSEQRVLGSGASAVTETENGAGAPFLGDAPDQAPASTAVVSVDLLRCKVWIDSTAYIATQRTTQGLPSATPSQGGSAFSIGERDIGALRSFQGAQAVAAVGTSLPNDHYDPLGLNNSLTLPTAGTANVRWLFRPAP